MLINTRVYKTFALVILLSSSERLMIALNFLFERFIINKIQYTSRSQLFNKNERNNEIGNLNWRFVIKDFVHYSFIMIKNLYHIILLLCFDKRKEIAKIQKEILRLYIIIIIISIIFCERTANRFKNI